MVIVFLQFDHIWVNLDTRSRQGQVNKCLILTFLIWENNDMFLMRNIPRIPMVPFIFSLCGTAFPNVVFYCMTSPFVVTLKK